MMIDLVMISSFSAVTLVKVSGIYTHYEGRELLSQSRANHKFYIT
jgi:hypothetical protein